MCKNYPSGKSDVYAKVRVAILPGKLDFDNLGKKSGI